MFHLFWWSSIPENKYFSFGFWKFCFAHASLVTWDKKKNQIILLNSVGFKAFQQHFVSDLAVSIKGSFFFFSFFEISVPAWRLSPWPAVLLFIMLGSVSWIALLLQAHSTDAGLFYRFLFSICITATPRTPLFLLQLISSFFHLKNSWLSSCSIKIYHFVSYWFCSAICSWRANKVNHQIKYLRKKLLKKYLWFMWIFTCK